MGKITKKELNKKLECEINEHDKFMNNPYIHTYESIEYKGMTFDEVFNYDDSKQMPHEHNCSCCSNSGGSNNGNGVGITDIVIGNVETLPYGQSAYATINKQDQTIILNLGIPGGKDGSSSSKQTSYIPNYKGVNIWIDGYNGTVQKSRIDQYYKDFKRLKFNAVFIVPYVTFNDDYTYSYNFNDEVIEYAIEQAKLNFQHVTIKIGYNAYDTNGNKKSSGGYNPADPNAFLTAYRDVVEHYAAMSNRYGLTDMVFINESKYTTKLQNNLWDDMLTILKRYNLKSIASFADLGEYESCYFKDKLDIVGINFYEAIIRGSLDMPISEAKKSYANNMKFLQLIRTSKKIREKGQKLFITEIGCTRNKDGFKRPANYSWDNNEMDDRSQYIFYSAFLKNLAERDIVDGIFIWSACQEGDNTFTPIGNQLVESLLETYIPGGGK